MPQYDPTTDPNFQGFNRPPIGVQPLQNATDTYATMTYQMWNDWVARFMPIENTLINYSADASLPGKEMQSAIGGVQDAFSQNAKTDQLSLKSQGISLNPDEQAAYSRDRNLNQSLSEVQAANTARDLTVSRQRSVLGAPAPQADTAAALGVH